MLGRRRKLRKWELLGNGEEFFAKLEAEDRAVPE